MRWALAIALVACARPHPADPPARDPVAALEAVIDHGGAFYAIDEDGCERYDVAADHDPDGMITANTQIVESEMGCVQTYLFALTIEPGWPERAGADVFGGGESQLVSQEGNCADAGGIGWGTIGCDTWVDFTAGPGGSVQVGGDLWFLGREACEAARAHPPAVIARGGC